MTCWGTRLVDLLVDSILGLLVVKIAAYLCFVQPPVGRLSLLCIKIVYVEGVDAWRCFPPLKIVYPWRLCNGFGVQLSSLLVNMA